MSQTVYRYKIENAWGSLAEAVGDSDHLLEREDCGPEKEWLIINVTTGEHTGGGWGSFDGKDQVCDCRRFLVSKEHDCPYRNLGNTPPLGQVRS